MTAGETTSYLIGQLLLPPVSLVFTALVGVVLAVWKKAAGLLLAAASLLLLLALSTPAAAIALVRGLEPPPLTTEQRQGAQAIVILTGGRSRAAPEWSGDTVNAASLRRARYGAQLARETGLPVLVTGGNPDRADLAEARLLAPLLEREFGIAPRWIEDASDTTAENAQRAAAMLRAEGISRVLLVTDAAHMPRALRVFTRAGLAPIAAPTGYAGQRGFMPRLLLPNVEALWLSNVAIRERAAGLWYRLRSH
jgi:uncharacterized SAM-binding protein YcdF (DUF218 family)